MSVGVPNSENRGRTKQDEGSDTGGIQFCIRIEETSVLDGEPVVKANVASDAKGEARGRVEGELDDGDACMGQGEDVEVCFWKRLAGGEGGGWWKGRRRTDRAGGGWRTL